MKKIATALFLLAMLPVVAYSQADQKLINKAQQGDVAAMVKLGDCYMNGAGVAHDSTLALKWFQKAAGLGDGSAWVKVSRFYLTGSAGMAKDTARFFSIRKEWADKGCPDALAGLASAYINGYGCKADTAKALELFSELLETAYATGDDGARESAASIRFYLHSAGVDVVDYTPGRESWFEFLPAPRPGTMRPALASEGKLIKKGLASKQAAV